MSNDLQADITTRLKGQGLTQATQGIEKVKSATDKLAGSQRDLQRSSGQALATMKAGATSTEQSMRRLKSAIEGLDGPMGAIAKRFVGAAGMEGGFGKIAAGVAIATTAFRALAAVNEVNVARARAFLDAQKQVNQALEQAANTRKNQGSSALAQGQSLRVLDTRGGQSAIDQANAIAASGITTAADAREGIASSLLVRGEGKREALIRVATRLAETGEVGFGTAINNARSDEFLMQLMETPDGEEEAARRMLVSARGQDESSQNLWRAGLDLRVSDRSKQNGIFKELRTSQGFINQIDEVGQRELANGNVSQASRQQLIEADNPEAAAIAKMQKLRQETLDYIDVLAEAQRGFLGIGKVLADINVLFGGDGGFVNQARRLRNAYGAADMVAPAQPATPSTIIRRSPLPGSDL
jgi:hypothetical protein